MTFDERRDQILLAESIGRLLDDEVSAEERPELLAKIQQTDGGDDLLRQMAHDDMLLKKAVAETVPQASLDMFQAMIDREFEKRQIPEMPVHHVSWKNTLVQMAAALVLIGGTFMFTSFWMQSRLDDTVSSLAAHMETERTLLAQTVQEALETKVSGETVQIGQGASWSEVLTPIKTYKSRSGHWCREYLRQSSFGKLDLSIRGTACRDGNGIWTTVLAEPVSDPLGQQTSGI
ncbi:hypothetical protein [Roseibium sp.]|uniref:hypothetical protein n=1 Tax=Roseibium sp. TaxID=1936156 RepID=UPI003D0C4F68